MKRGLSAFLAAVTFGLVGGRRNMGVDVPYESAGYVHPKRAGMGTRVNLAPRRKNKKAVQWSRRHRRMLHYAAQL